MGMILAIILNNALWFFLGMLPLVIFLLILLWNWN